MMIYFAPVVILLVIWVICTVGAFFFGLDEGLDKDEWQVVAAISTGAFFAIVFWPLVLPLAFVAGICYGLYSIFKVLGRVRRDEL